MFEWVGWVATGIFATSYFSRKPETLRRLQALAALLWLAYGVANRLAPVIAANLIVAVLALYSSWPKRNGVLASAESAKD